MHTFNTPIFEVAPYATFGILLLMVCSTAYLRRLILNYTQKKLPQCFNEFKLYEEDQDETSTLSLYRYITSNRFQQTNDPVFIGMCQRYMRWGQLFILFFVVAAIVDIGFIFHVL
ncbi:MAG: hypothetical protein AAGC78_05795 [Cellvibrio sp.]|uniref:hypothetical protein n=1 Tax=Cellvibrio sp. TaxID=1965322 RepID=UPI0031B0979F